MLAPNLCASSKTLVAHSNAKYLFQGLGSRPSKSHVARLAAYLNGYSQQAHHRNTAVRIDEAGRIVEADFFHWLRRACGWVQTVLLYGILPMPMAALGALWLWTDISGTVQVRTVTLFTTASQQSFTIPLPMAPVPPQVPPAICVHHRVLSQATVPEAAAFCTSPLAVPPLVREVRHCCTAGPAVMQSAYVLSFEPRCWCRPECISFAAQGSNTGIGHVAHLGGALTGVLFFLSYKRGLIRPRGYL